MPQVTTSVSLIGLREAAYYAIKCSAGTSIPVDEAGDPDGQVVLTFFRIDETGELVSYVAPYIIVDYGGIANAYNYDKDAWDITSLVSSASGTTLTVTVYEDTSASKVLASEVLSLIYPSSVDVEFPLELRMDGGSTAIFMTAYGEVKDGQDLLVTLEKGGEKVSGYIQYRLTMIDIGQTGWTSSAYISSSGFDLKSDLQSLLGFSNVMPSKIDFRYWESGGATKEASFLFEYASPIPVPRTDAWSSGNTYKNGEFFIDESTDMVYMWVYPKQGNTSVKPSSYISADTKPKRWEQVDLKYLIATEVLLARYGLVGKAVFYDEYMMSQQGVDNNGNESGNYTQYPSNFHPNILLNFMTGKAVLNDAEVRGVVSAGAVQSEFKLVSFSGTTKRNVVIKEIYNIMFQGTTSQPYIFLPNDIGLSGRVVRIAYGSPGFSGQPIYLLNQVYACKFVYSNQSYATTPTMNNCVQLYLGAVVSLLAVPRSFNYPGGGVNWVILESPASSNPGYSINTLIDNTLWNEYKAVADEADSIVIE